MGHALAGSTGAAISNISTYPLALIITRLQIQKQLRGSPSLSEPDDYKSIQDAARKIYDQEGGLKGLYTGLTYDTSKTVADSFLFFLAYNFLRQSRIRSRQEYSSRLPVLDELGVGVLAGAFSKLLTTPIANIVTRKQASSMMARHSAKSEVQTDSIRSIARQIRSEKGLQGFWSGYSASLVLTCNPSLTFFFFGTLKRMLVPRSQRSNLSPQMTFLLAALSKAMASTITYPFSLAKSRAQASSNKSTDNTGGHDKHGLGPVQAPRPGNVFATILHIANAEGLGALYDGLSGEVLKGFFGHGITMIVKDLVHKLIIRLYYAILRLLKRYPNPQIVGDQAMQKVTGVSNGLKHHAEAAANRSQKQAQGIVIVGQAIIEKHRSR